MIFLRFLIREFAGWFLVALGLFFMWAAFVRFANNPPFIIEATPIMVMGIFVFRGGIHLLKVAVAARICLSVKHEQREGRGTDVPFTRL